MSFAVAILGRPNVGKSTLFNRLVGRRLALVDNTPGLTRDRREGEGRIADLGFRVIDTAGLEEAAPASLEGRMRAHTERALAVADVALLVIDAREGVTEADRHFGGWLRRRPAVSTSLIGRSAHIQSTAIASRVIPASGPVNNRSSPFSRLAWVDFPTLGRPTMASWRGFPCSVGAASNDPSTAKGLRRS